jgi:SAM-dependent methyltransferase
MSRPAARRTIFDEVASLYDEVRPGYSTDVVDAIVAFAALRPDARILEIGCGTGQITLPFARRGYRIVALEPGAALAAIAAEKCRPYPGVEIVRQSFEDWPVAPRAFDLVLAAQAAHWIAPEYGCAKMAVALEAGGTVALVWHIDVSHETPFWKATQPIYDAYLPSRPGAEATDSLATQASRYRAALAASPELADLREIRRAWERTYTGQDYLKLLNTFSNHRALPEPGRTAFFQAIAATIERAGGVVHRKYETLLLLARRRQDTRDSRS